MKLQDLIIQVEEDYVNGELDKNPITHISSTYGVTESFAEELFNRVKEEVKDIGFIPW